MFYTKIFSISFLLIALNLIADPSLDEVMCGKSEKMVACSDFLIGGLIHPLSGQVCLQETDLVVRGAQDIILQRTFIPQYKPLNESAGTIHPSKKSYGGWVYFPQTHLSVFKTQKKSKNPVEEVVFYVVDENGAILPYQLIDGKTVVKGVHVGLCNGAHEAPSGRYDVRNATIEFNEIQLILKTSDGTCRHYQCDYRASISYDKQKYHASYLLLQKEVLPNGKVLRFTYTPERILSKVESLDPNERFVYATLELDQSPLYKAAKMKSGCGDTCTFSHATAKFLKSKHQKQCVDLLYPLHIKTICSPFFEKGEVYYEDEARLFFYNSQSTLFQCNYHPILNNQFGQNSDKVGQLFLPINAEKYFATYYLSYEALLHGSKTTVLQADGTHIFYYFNAFRLPLKIEYFDQYHTLIKTKTFKWRPNHWLESISLTDGAQNTLSEKRFAYDTFGNPILEIFKGDLNGDGALEETTIKREFSSDGRHLLLSEAFDDGKTVTYTYLPNTNLLTSCLTKGSACVLREFRTYDASYNLTSIIEDDGSGSEMHNLSQVTYRKIKNYILRQTPPFLHMPEWIEEKYLENNEEKLLKRTQLNYNAQGLVTEEHIYDAHNQFVCTLFKTYNTAGQLLSETNPIGQLKKYTYDKHGRLTSETSFSGRLSQEKTYDVRGRVVATQDKAADGVQRNESYTYDLFGYLIEKTDRFQQKTTYAYDLIARQPIEVVSPPLNHQGQSLPVVNKATFDALGRKLSSTDANGHCTTYTYNAYDLVTQINYPDESVATFRYTKTGQLWHETNPEGLSIAYTYDVLGHVISKTYIKDAQTIAQESFEYKGHKLVKSTDKEGHVTHLFYDGAGRKIKQERCGVVIIYSYDALGFLSTTCHENTGVSLYTHDKRDLNGRVIETTETDSDGHILRQKMTSYDADGNIATIEQAINGQLAIEAFSYDGFKRQITHTDAFGHLTSTIYNEGETLKITTIDPQQRSTIKWHDTHSHLTKLEKYNGTMDQIACDDFFYDPCGNLIEQQEVVYQDKNIVCTKKTRFNYDNRHRQTRMIRGFKTLDERQTAFTYTPSGQLATKTLPNGVVLSYTYDPFRNLTALQSSDHQLHHTFTYNKLGVLIKAADELQQFSITRTVDSQGNTLSETFPNGLLICKTYDQLNRLKSLKLPDSSQVVYQYDPLYYRQVSRQTASGHALYTHTYEHYDLSGHLMTEQLIYNVGIVTYDTDLSHRLRATASPFYRQSCRFDSLGNLSHQLDNCLASDYHYDQLSQLIDDSSLQYSYDSAFNRLTKDRQTYEYNALDELVSFTIKYDLNGNLIQKGDQLFEYDHLNRLTNSTIGDKKIDFTYDPLHRRIAKTRYKRNGTVWELIEKESFIYDGSNDIGTISADGTLKHLRVLGQTKHQAMPSTIALELEGHTYAPILDCQGNIRRLIDIKTTTPAANYDFSPFGEALHQPQEILSPWQYQSKRLDFDLQLIDFGRRHYDPALGRWLTVDPAGFINTYNLYQFNFNNPLRYTDPDGRFAFLLFLPFLTGTFELGAILGSAFVINSSLAAIGNAALVGVLTYASYKALQRADIDMQVTQGYDDWLRLEARGNKKGSIDENLPDDIFNDPNWENVSHPDAAANGNHKFKNKKTGEELRFDEGDPAKPGHRAHDHFHRPNPDSKNDDDKFLDGKGNPVPEHSEPSHLYKPRNK